MVTTTGSYPAALSGGSKADPEGDDSNGGSFGSKAGSGKGFDPNAGNLSPGSVTGAQAKGYSQRKAMAAGMVKAT